MKKLLKLWLLFPLLLMSACLYVDETKTAVPTTTTITNTPHPAITATMSGTSEIISSPTVDITVFPTLDSTEKEEYILSQLENNGGCVLPCWWGLAPGIATWSDTYVKYSELGFKSSQLESNNASRFGIGGFDLMSINTYAEVVFSVKEDRIENIIVSAGGDLEPSKFQVAWKYYSPDEILVKFGAPSRIWLDVSTYGTSDKVGYGFWLYYDDLGFLVIYSGTAQRKEILHICPSFNYDKNIAGIYLYLKSPNDNLSLETLLESDYIQTRGEQLKTFEEATGKSILEYFDGFMTDQKNICFDTSSSIWQ